MLTGDAETTTDPGIYVVRVKEEDYYSKKYQTPMPYSIFFNYAARAAIHGGEVPPCLRKEDMLPMVVYTWSCPTSSGYMTGRRQNSSGNHGLENAVLG